MIYIGVSACFFHPDPERAQFAPKRLAYLEGDMGRYLSRSDVMPILIPDVDEEMFSRYLEKMDGFVLQGGVDVSPESYGMENEASNGDRYRDLYEMKIVDYALKKDKPLIGICRGCQIINTYFGGTLHQKIQGHRDPALYDRLSHEIDVRRGSILSEIYPNHPKPVINSVHDQAVDTLGKGLQIEAVSSRDQVIEAVSYNDHRWLLGVQWHPEFSHTLKGNVLDPYPLIEAFFDQCKN